MAKINQKEYLKKYLSDGRSDHKRKKKRDYSDSSSSRVKIIDDNIDVSRRRAYDDDYDLILTGEDAPQIVGIVDDRPAELKTIEDFRSSGKWKTMASDGGGRQRDDNKYKDSYRQNTKYDQRRSKTPDRDYSPKRRTYSNEGSRSRQRSFEDSSPPRKKAYSSRDQRNPPATYNRTEKNTFFSDQDQARSKERFNPFRGTSSGYRDNKSFDKDRSINRSVRSDYSPQSRVSDSKSYQSASRQNPFKANPTVQSVIRNVDSHQSNESSSYNPFKKTTQPPPTNLHNSHSPTKGNGVQSQNIVNPRNPFRTNPMPRLSPLPEKRPQTSKTGRNPFKPGDKSFQSNTTTSNDTSFPPAKNNSTFKSNNFNSDRGKRNDYARSQGNEHPPRDNNRMPEHRNPPKNDWNSNNSNKFRSNNMNYNYNGQQKPSNTFQNRNESDRRSQSSNFRSAVNYEPKERNVNFNTNTGSVGYNHPQPTETRRTENRKSRWDTSSY